MQHRCTSTVPGQVQSAPHCGSATQTAPAPLHCLHEHVPTKRAPGIMHQASKPAPGIMQRASCTRRQSMHQASCSGPATHQQACSQVGATTSQRTKHTNEVKLAHHMADFASVCAHARTSKLLKTPDDCSSRCMAAQAVHTELGCTETALVLLYTKPEVTLCHGRKPPDTGMQSDRKLMNAICNHAVCTQPTKCQIFKVRCLHKHGIVMLHKQAGAATVRWEAVTAHATQPADRTRTAFAGAAPPASLNGGARAPRTTHSRQTILVQNSDAVPGKLSHC